MSRLLLSTVFLLGLWATVFVGASGDDIPLWGAEYCPAQDQKPTLLELRKLLEDEDPSGFNDGAARLTGNDIPSIEELSAMFNTLETGGIPAYITDNGYVYAGNCNTTFNYSSGNMGVSNTQSFQLFNNEESSGTHTLLQFSYIQGKDGDFEYTTGQALAFTTGYSRGEDSLTCLGSVKGSFMWQMPEGNYVSYGTYVGCSEGTFNLTCGAVTGKTDALAIMKTNQYFSKTVTENSGRYEMEKFSITSAMVSITGGSNATVTYTSSIPKDSSQGSGSINGTARNAVAEASLEGNTLLYMNGTVDRVHPFSNDNLATYFSAAGLNIGVYLP